jgi:hypothetical protein
VQLLREEVRHPPVAVVHEDAIGARGQGALDGGVGLARHQTAESVILSRMPRIDRIRLVLVNDTGHTFHVDGDVHPHGGSSDLGSGPRTVEIE